MPSSEQQQQLRQRFNEQLSPHVWGEGWASMLELDPAFFEASVSLVAVPHNRTDGLSVKDRNLVALAVDCAATHLYAPGVREHAKAALRAGAAVAEVVEVVELASTLGIHACNIGVPLLVEVLKERGGYDDVVAKPYDARQDKLKEDFTAKRGYWHTFWEDFLRLDPDFFEAYLDFSSVPWVPKDGHGSGPGVLSPKMKELVYCAFDCAATHLYVPGLRLHMDNALGYGATPAEILHVLEIATLLGLHGAQVALPIVEELAAAPPQPSPP